MAHPCFTSPWILNGINISNANYPPMISLLSFRHLWPWRCACSKFQDCGWWADIQLCESHLSIYPTVAEEPIPGISKSPQKLLLADQKLVWDQNHISSNWRTSWWRTGWTKAPCGLLLITPWTILWMLWCIFPKDCPGFRLIDLKTKSLKHGVDPCADMSVGGV